jgi:hypothetical protein
MFEKLVEIIYIDFGMTIKVLEKRKDRSKGKGQFDFTATRIEYKNGSNMRAYILTIDHVKLYNMMTIGDDSLDTNKRE